MRLDKVGRRYGLRGPWVLRGIDLIVPPGALLRVEGPNGSGKSTLLRLLAGIDAPSTGRITCRPRTAYVPERFPAALPFTAVGYLTHLGRVHGLRGAEATRRAHTWLERFGAAEHARTPLSELSKGSTQKVAVAQALLAEPGLLVLDEAWTGLDRTARTTLDDAVTERVAAGATAVFVDHDPRRLAATADTVLRVEGTALLPTPPAASGAVGPGSAAAPEAAPGAAVQAGTAAGEETPARSGTAAGEETLARSGTVEIEAEAPPGQGPGGSTQQWSAFAVALPGAPAVEIATGGVLRLSVPAAHSDALLHALLTARPPWHIRGVRTLSAPPRPS